jgi:hypothetical protein
LSSDPDMGEVWKARDIRLDRDVAIKVSKAEFTARFDREARAIPAFNRPNICQIYDVRSELPRGGTERLSTSKPNFFFQKKFGLKVRWRVDGVDDAGSSEEPDLIRLRACRLASRRAKLWEGAGCRQESENQATG